MAPKLSKEDRAWRARDDAYTLIQAEAIAGDKSSRASANKAIKEVAKQKEQEVKAAKKALSKTKPTKIKKSKR